MTTWKFLSKGAASFQKLSLAGRFRGSSWLEDAHTSKDVADLQAAFWTGNYYEPPTSLETWSFNMTTWFLVDTFCWGTWTLRVPSRGRPAGNSMGGQWAGRNFFIALRSPDLEAVASSSKGWGPQTTFERRRRRLANPLSKK